MVFEFQLPFLESHLFYFAVATGAGCGGGAGRKISHLGGEPDILAVVGTTAGELAARAGAGALQFWQRAVLGGLRGRGLDPHACLKDVLTRLPQMTSPKVPDLLPAVWGKPAQPLLRKAS